MELSRDSVSIVIIPQEICDIITDQLSSRTRTLKSICRVCRAFRFRARRYLFRTVVLFPLKAEGETTRKPAPNTCSKFYDLILESPELATYVHNLEIIDTIPQKCRWTGRMIAESTGWIIREAALKNVLLSLTNIRSFHLQALLQMDTISRFMKAPLTRLFKFPRLRKVSINGIGEVRMMVLLSWLGSNRSIKSISLVNCGLRYHEPPWNQKKNESASFRSLRTLHLSPCLAMSFARWLSNPLTTASLHSLTRLIIADHDRDHRIPSWEFQLVNDILHLAGDLDFFQTELWSGQLPSVRCDVSRVKRLSILSKAASFPECARYWFPTFYVLQGTTDEQPSKDRLEYLDFSFFSAAATIDADLTTLKDTLTIWSAVAERMYLKQFKVTVYMDAPSLPPSSYTCTKFIYEKDSYDVLAMARPESDFKYGAGAELDKPVGIILENLPAETTEPVPQ